MAENRVRTAMRASRIVWWMGMCAAVASAGALVQGFLLGTVPRVATIDAGGELVVSDADLSRWDGLLPASPDIVTLGALAAAAFLLSPILVAVAGGHSFGAVAQRNLHRISVILVISAAVAIALGYLASWHVTTAVASLQEAARADGVDLTVLDSATTHTLPWLPLALGVIAGAFRWVIRDGAALEKDVEGVI